MDKKVLRRDLTVKRLGLSPSEVKEYSEKILNTLSIYIDWSRIRSLHLYLPIKENNEIDTGKLVDSLKQNHPNIRVEIAPQKPGAGVPAPKPYDLVIVPVLGFDRYGYRLGYGGGYYDKFLAANTCNKIIGLAYSFSEIAELPVETHDQKLHTFITEKEIIKVT